MACMEVSGQYYNLAFRNYTSMNGLSQSEVNCVFKDRDGFIWIGTEFGLTEYDGKEFTTFYHRVNDPKSIGENTVRDITQDKNGFIWMTTGTAGICKLDPLNKKFVNFKASNGGNSILGDKANCIYTDQHNRVWIGLEDGISMYDNNIATFRNLKSIKGRTELLSVNCVTGDILGNTWLGTQNGIARSSTDLEGLEYFKTNLSPGGVNAIQLEDTEKGWIATETGLYKFQLVASDSLVLERPVFLPSTEPLQDVEFDSKGNLWIASISKGLRIYFPKTGFFDQLKEDFNSSRGLLSNRIHDLYNDNKGGMWVSGENGLQSFHEEAQRFNIYPGLSFNSERVRGSTMYGVSEKQNVIILATSGGIIIYDRNNGKYFPVDVRHKKANQAIRFREIHPEGPGKWWITSDAGMFELVKAGPRYVLRQASFFKDSFIENINIRSYFIDGNYIWMGTANDGLIKFDMNTGKYIRYVHDINNALSLPTNVTYKVISDSEGNIVVAQDMGLSILYKGARDFENYGTNDVVGKRLSNRQVFDVVDDGKRYWIATIGGGLNVMDKSTKKISHFTTENGLSNDAIYKIVTWRDSVLWLGTNKGLSSYNINSNRFLNFDVNDGMPADEFNMYAGYVNEQGEVFMGTIAGLVSFKPDELQKNLMSPGIFLSRIRKNGLYQDDSTTGVVNRDKQMTVKYGEDVFLEFHPLIFYSTTESILYYRIKEQGEDWAKGEAGGLLPLVKMEPGSYTIDVVMKKDNGLRNSNIMTIKLEVLPPFWKTVWFRAVSSALILLMLYLAIRSYIKRRLERQRVEFTKQQAVEKERLRISAELHDDIGGGLTAIRLLSEMSLEHDKGSDNRKYLEKISSAANDIIQKMNEIVWALNNNNDNLQSLIAYTRLYTVSYLDDLDIDYHFDTPEFIPEITVLGKNRRSVFLLVKEALNNIAKHADASSVDVKISVDDKLRISISDDGIGFKEHSIVKGNGLNNMANRVHALKGEMAILNGKGTTVQFEIPVKSLYA